MIDAADRQAALQELRRRGQTPTSLVEIKERNGSGSAGSANGSAGASSDAGRGSIAGVKPAMSKPEVTLFVRELATSQMAGLPLVQGLRTIERQERKPRKRALIAGVIDAVEHGKSLSDAMAQTPRVFGDLPISLARAGEVSGKLDEVLSQAADLMERSLKLRRAVLGAMAYPALLGLLVIAAVGVIVTVIVPKMLEPLRGQAFNLPLPTRIVMETADFFKAWWWLVGIALAAAVFGLMTAWRNPDTRAKIERVLLATPVLGVALKNIAIARFTRTLATLIAAGIPVLTALKVTKGTLGNRPMEMVIDEVCEQISAGKTIAEPMERSGYFPPMLTQIVGLGERSGRLDELLARAAAAFEEKTELSLKVLTSLLPPIMVIFAAGMVGFIVLAILLAMLQFQDSVTQL